MSSKISTRRIVVQSTIWLEFMFACLFGGAGTLAWPEACFYIFIQTSSSAAMVLWLRKRNPELLKVRMESWQRMSKPWDKAIMIFFIAGRIPLFILPGLDAIRYHWSHVALPTKILGFAVLLGSSALIFWVLKTNPYSSAAVEIQKKRGHKPVTTGLYRFVRHPMYVGAILWFISIPLALGSLTTLIPATILAALIVLRTYLEDKTLQQELEGYAAYTQTVKYRLIPRIW
ncbi:MAG: isoprenylcysteine carboxylmethyltransferase family protein [Desulfomonilaceae bacterium]